MSSGYNILTHEYSKICKLDIKGANLLVDASGVVKLADFEVAKHNQRFHSSYMDNSRAVDGSSRSTSNGPLNVLVLKHVKGRTNEKSKDVTTFDWNCLQTTMKI
ncbi:uncharacterized protein LOC115955845 isoform X3 [Quercus lobata]|uniref:uncharacterized protein LOC115955845 isoform X3 n=1 Tax=Quercus lobata TaxID=97700 RepID=UPI00124917F7|nr:uncharacterized protein LOC115955845 isoform X3 [Quercus lobata]